MELIDVILNPTGDLRQIGMKTEIFPEEKRRNICIA